MAGALSGENLHNSDHPLDDDHHDTDLTYPTQAGQTKGPRQPDRSRVTVAPKIYASAYSDEIWIMLKEYTKEVLRTSPKDILAWSTEYFHRRVMDRRLRAEEWARAHGGQKQLNLNATESMNSDLGHQDGQDPGSHSNLHH